MAVKTYPFEGEQRTLTEVCAMVPALSRQALRVRLDMGQSTVIEMMAYRKPVPKASTRFCGELRK